MTAKIRKIEARDEARWRELWDGYCRFYERDPAPKVNDHTAAHYGCRFAGAWHRRRARG